MHAIDILSYIRYVGYERPVALTLINKINKIHAGNKLIELTPHIDKLIDTDRQTEYLFSRKFLT
jgi:hypothetical protein